MWFFPFFASPPSGVLVPNCVFLIRRITIWFNIFFLFSRNARMRSRKRDFLYIFTPLRYYFCGSNKKNKAGVCGKCVRRLDSILEWIILWLNWLKTFQAFCSCVESYQKDLDVVKVARFLNDVAVLLLRSCDCVRGRLIRQQINEISLFISVENASLIKQDQVFFRL